jgi:acyl carrier protein
VGTPRALQAGRVVTGTTAPQRAARVLAYPTDFDPGDVNMATTQAQPQDIEAMVIESLAEFGADREALSRDATLDSVDVDSLDLVELTQVVEERYDIDLENADFKQIKTVGDIVDLVVARVEG